MRAAFIMAADEATMALENEGKSSDPEKMPWTVRGAKGVAAVAVHDYVKDKVGWVGRWVGWVGRLGWWRWSVGG